MTIKISWSSLRTHEECKQKGHLQRSGKKASLEDFRIFFPGTVTDRVVRDWLLDEPINNPGRMPSMVEAIMDREEEEITNGRGTIRWQNLDDRAKVKDECIEAVTKIEPSLTHLVLPYEYQPDYRFTVPMDFPHPKGGHGQVILNGALDILVKDNEGNYQVWDVKHTRNKDYWRKTEGQLTFYDLAISALSGKTTSMVGLLQPLCENDIKSFIISEDKRRQLLSRIMAMATDMWNDDFAPRADNRYCTFCAVKHACPKFQRNDDKRMKLL